MRIAAVPAAAWAYYTGPVSSDDPRGHAAPGPVDPDPSAIKTPPPAEESPQERPAARRVAVNTFIFSLATGASRLAGLVREILASSYFATTGAFSAFTLAFQVPNLIRTLVADQAVTAAFVPVFTELLDQGKKREAAELASTFFFLILMALTAITALFTVTAGVLMPLFTGGQLDHLDYLVVGLSQVLFPIVILLGLNGLVVGILNAYDHFTIPGLAPLFWNFVIIGVLVALKPLFHGPDQLYAYAIGVLIGTLVQLLVNFPVLKRLGFHFERSFNLRDPRIRQVLKLMLPVTIGLGAINFVLVINSSIGSLVSENAPRAIDAAFRIYMLPQGMFSVALATVLFPALARYASRNDMAGLRATMANGVRQIYLLLIPAAALTVVLATPITRLIYQHGEFGPDDTHRVATALFWFSFSLPLNGANLMMTRTFFSLQRPWLTSGLSVVSVIIAGIAALLLYKPFGIAGVVLGSAIGNLATLFGQMHFLRRTLGGIEGRATLLAVIRMVLASAVLGAVAYGTWYAIDRALGRTLIDQTLSVGVGTVLGFLAYGIAVMVMRVREAEQIRDLVKSRLPSRA
jgi:putative peptidoglycan lipid II flippase